MTKTRAVRLFGGTQADLARALGITRGAVAQWPKELPQRTVHEVVGAALRKGIPIDVIREALSGDDGEDAVA